MTYKFEASRHLGWGIAAGLADIREALRRSSLWVRLAFEEIKDRYHRTAFGYLWIIFIFLFQAIIIYVFFGEIRAGYTSNYFEHVAFGFLVFIFLANGVTNASTVYTRSQSWLMSSDLPYTLFILRDICREGITLGVNFLVMVGYKIVTGGFDPLKTLLAMGMMVIITFNIYWGSLFLGILATRFRDLQQLIAVIMRIFLFVCPVIWVYGHTGSSLRTKLAIYNPFTHYLEAVRRPMMGEWPTELNLLVVFGTTIPLIILGLFTFCRYRRRIPFWL